MSYDDTISPEIDDEIRGRLQAFAQDVTERSDAEAALQRMPRRSRPPTSGLVAIAACLLLAVAIAAVVRADRQSVDTVPPAQSPTNTLGDGPKTLARGVVEFVELPAGGEDGCCVPPGGGLAGQTLDITAVEDDGQVSGEARFNGIVVELECLDTTAPEGVVVLGGEVTTSSGESAPSVGSLIAMIIREGEPDSATVWPGEMGQESCAELFRSMPVPWSDYFGNLVDVVDGDDIDTGG